MGFDKTTDKNPRWARKMRFEPGKGTFVNEILHEKTDYWRSDYPNVDIRHRLNLSSPKINAEDFVPLPNNWQQVTIDKIPGWDLKKMFQIPHFE